MKGLLRFPDGGSALEGLSYSCKYHPNKTNKYRAEGGPVMCRECFLDAYLIRCAAKSCKDVACVFCADCAGEYCMPHGIEHVQTVHKATRRDV